MKLNKFPDRIPGGGGASTLDYNQGQLNMYMPMDNMFSTTRDEDKMFDAFPETFMKSEPIYKVAAMYESPQYRFYPTTGAMLDQLLQNCIEIENNQISKLLPHKNFIQIKKFLVNAQPYQGQIYDQYAFQRCPDRPAEIRQDCGDSVPCLYDYTMLNAKIIAHNTKDLWNTFVRERMEAVRQCKFHRRLTITTKSYI